MAHDASVSYPEAAPFDPPEAYAELGEGPTDPGNRVYGLVRQALLDLDLDAPRRGTADWNPLADLVASGGTVLVKPNLVYHRHAYGGDPGAIVTHASVVRPVIDYARKAVGSSGRVLVADAPQANADWDELLRVSRIGDMARALASRGIDVAPLDLRRLVAFERNEIRVREEMRDRPAVRVELGAASYLAPLGATLANVFGSDYDRRATASAHGAEHHAYMVAREVLDADLVVTVPKLKTHRKVGVTVALKGMVGINVDKNFIPHYRVGDERSGGDEQPSVQDGSVRLRSLAARKGIDLLLARFQPVLGPATAWAMGAYKSLRDANPEASEETLIERFYREVLGQAVRAGNWPGNDTLWRAVLDLCRILHYARRDGSIGSTVARGYLCVADGIVGGEGPGPLTPKARPAGVVLAGTNPAACDFIAALLMGFAPERIPLLAHALGESAFAPEGSPRRAGGASLPVLPFEPPKGWEEVRLAAAPVA